MRERDQKSDKGNPFRPKGETISSIEAKGRARTEGIIESVVSDIPLPVLVCEAIDNALLKRKKICDVTIEISRRNRFVRISNSDPVPMSIEEAGMLGTVGASEEEKVNFKGGESGEHRVGGTGLWLSLATLRSSLIMITPSAVGTTYFYEKQNYKANVAQDTNVEEIASWQNQTDLVLTEPDLSKLTNAQIYKIIDYLEMAYREPMLEGKLKIRVGVQEANSITTKFVDLQPVDIPYAEKYQIDPIRVEGMEIEVEGGIVDESYREYELERQARITRQEDKKKLRVGDSYPDNQAVYFSVGGRLLAPLTLQTLKVPGWTRKNTLDPMIFFFKLPANENIRRGAFKEKFQKDNPTVERIKQMAREVISPFIEQRLKTSPEPEDLTTKYSTHLERLHERLNKGLLMRYGDPDYVAKLFNFDLRFISESPNPKIGVEEAGSILGKRKKSDQKRTAGPYMPGLGTPTRTTSYRDVVDGETSEVHEFKINKAIPGVRVEAMKDKKVLARIETRGNVGDAEQIQVLVLNSANESISRALKALSSGAGIEPAMLVLERAAIEAFFENRGEPYIVADINELHQQILTA